MKVKRNFAGQLGSFFLFSALVLTGCGGGGGGGGDSGTSSSTTGTISGTAVKGPVNGGTVTAYRINSNGTRGTQIGTSMTDAQGNFSMQVGDYSGAVMLQLSGGQYRDEAIDQLMNMDQNTVMTALIPDMASGEMMGNIEITPLTSMAQAWAQNMAGGMTQANITLANRNMGQYFDVGDILTTQPMDPLVQDSGAGANQEQRNYGMTLAAMSQEAYELTMTYSSGIVTAMMDDASDGKMDGMMGGNGISMGGMGGMMGGIMMQSTAGTSDLASAMTTFVQNTTYNRSGLTTMDMQMLIDKLNASNGNI
jgi:hypothetical protein